MIEWWQQFPEHNTPVVFSIGFFSLRAYALCFAFGILGTWFWMRREWRRQCSSLSYAILDEYVFVVSIGAFIGARMGYVLWYAPHYFFEYPWEIVSPFDSATGRFIGIMGLSFHGALLGVGVATWCFARIRSQSVFFMTDRLVSAVPIGIFFGRLGNFLNGELWGRATSHIWGMYFPLADTEAFPTLRHPSTLYEMVGEGVLLFFALQWVAARRSLRPAVLTGYSLVGYGFIRIFLEFFREPDSQVGLIGGAVSLGQVLSLPLIIGGVWLIGRKRPSGHTSLTI